MSLKELLLKKANEGKFLNDDEIKAKKSVLSEIEGILGEEMSSKLKGLKKVTIASPTKEGLEAGLEKAKETISDMPDEPLSKEDQIKKLKEQLKELEDNEE